MQTQTIDAPRCASTHPHVASRISLPSVIYSLLLLFPGIAAFLFLYEEHDKSTTFSMALLAFGSIFIVYGLYRLLWKSKVLVYLPTGSVAEEQCLFFDLKYMSKLVDLLNKDSLSADTSVRCEDAGNVRMSVVLSADNRFAAVQLFQFVPYNYAPITPIRYYTEKEAAAVSAFLEGCKKKN